MKKVSVVALFFVLSSTALAQNLKVVNAASLTVVPIAPGSIFTIFGTNLTSGVAFANNVQSPPANLGGVTVSIGGSPASLFYVSLPRSTPSSIRGRRWVPKPYPWFLVRARRPEA